MCVILLFDILVFPDSPICALHLINKGLTITGNNATIEWEGTGPSATTVVSAFECRLDVDAGGIYMPCKMLMWEGEGVEEDEGSYVGPCRGWGGEGRGWWMGES